MGDVSRSSAAAPSSPLDDQPTKWRNLVAYWLLGLCNNYGYVVMLSAAHDILGDNFIQTEKPDILTTTSLPSVTKRDCNYVSTGAILLADILPSLSIKLTAPFFPFHVHIRMMIVVFLSAAGFLLVALASAEWIAVVGVVATSLGSGLGEVTLLSYSMRFDKNVVSTWSSGTGGAGIFGAISYAGLTSAGVSPSNSILLMLVVPAIMAASFWLILSLPKRQPAETNETVEVTQGQATTSPLASFIDKVKKIPPLYMYMFPIGAVYFFEYFINQGLFELVDYRGIWLDHSEQYRWLQVDYQIGVFVSRSSVNLITIRQVWILAVLQFVNVIVFLFQVVYEFMPNIWMVFALVLFEGLLGGAAYVNTFYRITKEVPKERLEFSLGIASLADAMGIALAGYISIPIHNALCDLPRPV